MDVHNNVAHTIVRQLKTWGIDVVFGVVGDAVIPLVDALDAAEGIRFSPARREDAAACMASAYAKLTGKPGVCIGTSGPGAVNLLNGVADAAQDRVPLVVITGQVDSIYVGTAYKQYFDHQTLFRSFAAYSAQLASPGAAAEVVNRALKTAVAGCRVTHVSVPRDLFSAPAPAAVRPPEPYLQTPARSPENVLAAAADILNRAEKPVILAGRGTRGLTSEVLELAEKLGAGVMYTLPATGVIPFEHPLALGGLGLAGKETAANALARADLCLMIGANWWPKEYAPSNVPVVQVDLAPENIGVQTPVAFGVVGNAAAVVPYLSARLNRAPNPEWTGYIGQLRAHWQQLMVRETGADSSPTAPQRLVRDIQNTIAPDAVIALDVGDHVVWFARVFEPVSQDVLVSGRWRSMGFGLPAGLAAKMAAPQRQVVVFAGDGGFAMSMAEFSTAVQYKLPVTVVVANNGTLAMEKNRMLVGGYRPSGVDLANPDFAAYARSAGGLGLRVERPGELPGALAEALYSGRPALVDVLTAAPVPPGTKP
ncbi:MAG: thiamine pyrophosphate-binding protein [Candidatus Desulforudis sp.]|nr:thiamine pyrophosphate-binding protein [Desulforudis sp.]